MDNHPKQAASSAAFSGFMMLLCGGYLFQAGYVAVSSMPALYSAAIDIFKWTLLSGGILLLAASAVCAVGRPIGLIMDAAVSGACGVSLVFCSAVWFVKGKGFSIRDAVVLIFALMLLRESIGAWRMFGPISGSVKSPPVDTPLRPEPIHPASIRPDGLPAGDEAPPEGYLAALAKDKQDPPSASYE